MCQMCDAGIGDDPILMQQWFDQQDALLRDRIRRVGWAFQSVDGADGECRPGFTYSIGMGGFDHPEFVVFGLAPAHCAYLLNELCSQVRAGGALRDGDDVQTASLEFPVRLFSLPNPDQVLLLAQAEYRLPGSDPMPALQVTYADFRGRYPWEPGYCYPQWLQPMPGTFSA